MVDVNVEVVEVVKGFEGLKRYAEIGGWESSDKLAEEIRLAVEDARSQGLETETLDAFSFYYPIVEMETIMTNSSEVSSSVEDADVIFNLASHWYWKRIPIKQLKDGRKVIYWSELENITVFRQST